MYRQIHTSIWAEPWFEPLSASAKLLFLYLCLCDQTQPCGAWHGSYRRITFEAGLTTEHIDSALVELDKKVERFSNTGELVLWIRRFAHWQDKGGNWHQAVKRSLNHQCSALQSAFAAEYPSIPIDTQATGINTHEDPSIPSLAVSVSVSEHSTQNHRTTEPQNTVSVKTAAPSPKPPAKRNQSQYPTFAEVKVDTKLLEEMKKRYPNLDLDYETDRCEEYWRSSGRTLKSAKLALQNWLAKASEIAKQTIPQKGQTDGRISGVPGNRPAGAFADVE